MCFRIVSMAAKWIKDSLRQHKPYSSFTYTWSLVRVNTELQGGRLPSLLEAFVTGEPRSDFLERCQSRSFLSFWRPWACRSQQSRASNSKMFCLPLFSSSALTASAPFLSLLRTLWLHWHIDNNVQNLRVSEGHQESTPVVTGLRVKVWMFLWGDVTWRPRLLPCKLVPLHSGCLSARSVT